MSSQGGSSKRSSNSNGNCKECVRMRQKGHFNAREPKYCERHQCPCKDVDGTMCIDRKKAGETCCTTHAQCKVGDCRDPRAGILNDYCENHKCVVEDCYEGKAYDPARQLYSKLCAGHLSKVCRISTCNYWQFEHGGEYCEQHTCIENCNGRNLTEAGSPFCAEHNICFIEGCRMPRYQNGDEYENVCYEHYTPRCRVETCNLQSSPVTRYCDLHSCRYASHHERCKKEARPGRAKPFCVDHRCSDHGCQFLRSFSEIRGVLRMNAFCPNHKCRDEACVKHTIPDKPFCHSHCCTNPDCTEARDGDPRFGTLCFPHYEEKQRIRIIEEQRAANARAEEVRRQAAQAPVREGDRRERRERKQEPADAGERPDSSYKDEGWKWRQQPADAGRRPDPGEEDDGWERRQQPGNAGRRFGIPRRPASSPPRQQHAGQEGPRPWPQQQHDNGHDDEGYRSNRSSGQSFEVGDGW